MEHARETDVVDELPTAGQEAPILDARERLPE
jgi:hypothetical protein